MGKEIERKFLVDKIELKKVLGRVESNYCAQTYLSKDEDKVIRVRVLGNKGFLTIKSKVTGISRDEFEYEIPLTEAQQMISIFGTSVIEKTRYYIPIDNHTWEVDVFEGENKGLIVAEIELSSESELFEKPIWIIKEVTGDLKYYNSNLQTNPFLNW